MQDNIIKKLSKDEIQVALAMRHFFRRQKETKKNELIIFCKNTFGKYLKNFNNGLNSLIEKSFIISKEDDIYSMSDDGYKLSNEIQKVHPIWIYFFNDFYEKVEKSLTFDKLATTVYGKNLYQQGQMDMNQLSELLKKLNINENDSILELGCGNGYITEYIHEKIGCNIKGLDISDIAINNAIERTKNKVESLSFEIGNVQYLSKNNISDNKYDIILSIDTLHLAANLEEVIIELIKKLKLNGKIAIFWESWIRENIEKSNLLHENTRLGKVLNKLNLTYETVDLSSENDAHWKLRRDTLIKLEKDFLKENNEKLYSSLFDETKRLDWGTGTRILYVISM